MVERLGAILLRKFGVRISVLVARGGGACGSPRRTDAPDRPQSARLKTRALKYNFKHHTETCDAAIQWRFSLKKWGRPLARGADCL